MTDGYEVGMVGLGIMGRNLALNILDKGYPVVGYDKDREMVRALELEGKGRLAAATESLQEMVTLLRPPRAIMILVPAGAVDAVIEGLAPYLQPGDVIMDGGNSYFRDTDHRAAALAVRDVLFMGVGISGGEEGARHGPSIMPGGPRAGYERIRPVLEAIAARVDGEPCVAYLGPASAGHYVKMVHNGIEYGLMGIIAESYDLMKRGLGIDNDGLRAIYDEWSRTELRSYLMEITAHVVQAKDQESGRFLVDLIVDEAEAKGTGKWTAQDAMDLGIPAPAVQIAVSMRDLSALREERRIAGTMLPGPEPVLGEGRQTFVKDLARAVKAAFVITYAQGMAQLRTASKVYAYGIRMEDVARIWRGGCIIRSDILEPISEVLHEQPDLANLLLHPRISEMVAGVRGAFRAVVCAALELGIPVPCLAGCLTYYDAYRSSWLPANLIQAQRDYFGSHGYHRVDKEGFFHSEWK